MMSESYYGYSDELIEEIIGYAPSSFLLCWSSAIFVKNATPYHYYFLVIPFVIIGFLNMFVTYCQSNGIFGTEFLLERLNALNEEETSYILRHGNRSGMSVSGIFVTPVRNGHISLLFLLAIFLLRIPNLLIFLSCFIILVGLFFCQQRSAFLLGIFFFIIVSSYMLYKSGHKKILYAIIVVCVFVTPVLLAYILSLDTRVSDINLNNREKVYAFGLDYIGDHFILGSYYQFMQDSKLAPHNLIMSAFISGGLIGGGLLMYLVFLQLSLMHKILRRDNTHEAFVIVCMYLAMTCDSLFHNSGLVEMNGPTLLAWGLVLGISKKYKK